MTHEELMKLAQTGELTEDAILQITQETRRSMLVGALSEGIPGGKDMYRVMKLLEDMDGTALNMKKIESDDANADADRKASLFISEMNKRCNEWKSQLSRLFLHADYICDPSDKC